jgi:hypothetical protein
MVNLVDVLNTELDHALDELGKAWVEIAELSAKRAEHRHQEDGSPAPVGTEHPNRSPPLGHHTYGTPDYRTWINLEPWIARVGVCKKCLSQCLSLSQF